MTFEHIVECPVRREFAWQFWTTVTNWKLDADVESVELDGPFATGSRGVTFSRSSGRIPWQLAAVYPPSSAVIEFPLPGAVAQFHWTFEDLGDRTRLTQRVSLAGEHAAAFAPALASLEAGIPAGMQKLCTAMADAAAPFQFLNPGDLRDGDITLQLVATHPADPAKNWVPYYDFHILTGDRRAGEIHLRIGNTEHMRLYGGHVAYGVRPEFRGHHFAARALKLLLPLARRHGLSELWITCNPENIASRRTCELAGAQLVNIVDLPPHIDMYLAGERQKCRYRLDLREGPGTSPDPSPPS